MSRPGPGDPEFSRRSAAVRREQTKLRRAAARGEASIDDLVSSKALRMRRVEEVISYLRGFGESRAKWVIESAGVSPYRTVGALTDRQRRAVAESVRSAGG